jgi:intracellular septation protein
MVTMPVFLFAQCIVTKKINKMYLASTILIIILGSATLFFRNPTFLYWKPTVLNWMIAVAFFASQWIGEKTIIQRMLGTTIKLRLEQWIKLNYMWITFFLVSGTINIYVAYNFPEAFWVKFKLFGLMGMTILFVIFQSIWLSITMKNNESYSE